MIIFIQKHALQNVTKLLAILFMSLYVKILGNNVSDTQMCLHLRKYSVGLIELSSDRDKEDLYIGNPPKFPINILGPV